MITEVYVSFETARLLKDKGFNEKVICYYDDGGSLNLNKFVEFQCCNQGYGSGVFAAPTLQMVMKWLREVHNIYIDISIYVITKDMLKYNINVYHNKGRKDSMYSGIHLTKECTKYEDACEMAIKYCLENLI